MRLALLLAPLLILASAPALAKQAGTVPDRERQAESRTAKAEAGAGIDVGAREAEVRAALAQDYEPSPAIWKLADTDTVIYLFGTTHALPAGFKWRSPALDDIIADADELVLETVDDPADERSMIAALIDMKPRPPIIERVSEDKRDALREAIARAGMTTAVLDIMPTWLAAFMFGFAQLDMMGQDSAFGVETVLEADFRKADKPISAVEDGMAVLATVQALPEPVQRKMLEDTISADPREPRELAQNDHLWARGKLDAIAGELTPEEMGAEVYGVLLRDRNRAWTDWLATRLDKPGTVLFAVGAGHLVGPDSVQRLLAKKGLVATRLE